jgi:hypothetical protein
VWAGPHRDASLIVADAHRQRGVDTPDQLDPKANRAVAEYFALDEAATGQHSGRQLLVGDTLRG